MSEKAAPPIPSPGAGRLRTQAGASRRGSIRVPPNVHDTDRRWRPGGDSTVYLQIHEYKASPHEEDRLATIFAYVSASESAIEGFLRRKHEAFCEREYEGKTVETVVGMLEAALHTGGIEYEVQRGTRDVKLVSVRKADVGSVQAAIVSYM